MFILALTQASAIEEMADAMHARLTTDFGDGTCDPSHIRCLQLSMPFPLTDAEARVLHQHVRDLRHVRAPGFERIVLRQGFVFIEGGAMDPATTEVADKLGGFARRMTFVVTPHMPVTRILRKEAEASALELARSIGVPDPIYFANVALMQREQGTRRLTPYTGEAAAA